MFTSNAAGLEIVLDRGQVVMKIGKSVQNRQDWLEWAVVIATYAPEVKAYDFELDIDAQVRRISELLQLHCAKLLEGDFNDDRLLRIIEDKIGKDFRKRFS